MKKIALVTGSSRGIGREIALLLAKEGYEVILHGQTESKALKETERLLKKLKALKTTVVFDVSKKEEVEASLSSLGRVDVLVNNAGISKDNSFIKMPEIDFDEVIKTNLYGPFYVTKQILPKMIENKYGRIINISSVAANGAYGKTNYASAKAGLIGFTKSLALEVAKYNITVNAVSPGFIEAGMSAKIPNKYKKMILANTASKRAGKPEEVASLVSFLARKDSSYITGEVININGGWM